MQGYLLLNLGTPDAPTTSAVRRYLREFLHDPRVVDLPALGRWLLVEGVILPTRPRKSAEAYRKIWTPEGSPLLLESLQLLERVRARLGPTVAVELGMRYGNPSIAAALDKLRAAGVTHLVAAPLYPQYSSAATGSSLEAVFAALALGDTVLPVATLPAFYDDPGFLDAFAAVGRTALGTARADHVLFSFHGLPERQVRRADPSGTHCLASGSCCAAIGAVNRDCYRAQCYATARGLAERLGLVEGGWTVTFQSRLGRTAWISPATDAVIPELAAQGKKRLAVFCPAFVADCLETLEEVGMRAREQFRSLGGEDLVLVPSLNASAPWVEALCGLLARCTPAIGGVALPSAPSLPG
jgi:ferrochelatase